MIQFQGATGSGWVIMAVRPCKQQQARRDGHESGAGTGDARRGDRLRRQNEQTALMQWNVVRHRDSRQPAQERSDLDAPRGHPDLVSHARG